MNFQDWNFDKRVLKRNILNGTISREEYHQYLKSLPDMKDHIADEDEELDAEESASDSESSSSDSNG